MFSKKCVCGGGGNPPLPPVPLFPTPLWGMTKKYGSAFQMQITHNETTLTSKSKQTKQKENICMSFRDRILTLKY